MTARSVASSRRAGPPAPLSAGSPRRSLGLGRWAKGQSVVATTRLVTWGLVGAFVVVAGMAFIGFVRPAPRPPVVHIPPPTTGAEGVAELFVAAWLGTPQSDLSSVSPYWAGHATFGDTGPLAGQGPAPVRVLRTTSVEAREVRGDYWAVVVAATSQADANAAVTVRFFRVGVLRTPTKAYVATSLPSEVAAPLGSREPELAVSSMEAPGTGDPVAGAVNRFLGALLAGDGELSRYVSPGATVKAVRPAPYTAVQITAMGRRALPGTDGHLEVLVNAVGKEPGGRYSAFSYPLQLAQRAGRWEVVAVLAAPTLAGSQPDLAPAPPAAVAPTLPPPTYVPAGPATTVGPIPTTAPAVTTTTTRRF